MAAATRGQVRKLKKYLLGERPGEDGEWGMYCPLHDDANRSASLNVAKGTWFCQAGCGGGTVEQLIDARDTWVPMDGRSTNGSRAGVRRGGKAERVSEGMVEGWHSALLAEPTRMGWLSEERGIEADTVVRHKLGWDSSRSVYTIPVFSLDDELWNVRRYDPDPQDDRRKIYSVNGMGAPRLYPISTLADDPPYVIICEGEWDALLTLQNGYPAITRTGAADTWKKEWSKRFEDKVVYLAHDCDDKGQKANRKLAKELANVASEVRVLALPYAHQEKHGKDLSDFWLDYEDHASAQMQAMLEDAQLFNPSMADPETIDPSDASVLDSFDARRVAEAMRLTVTIKGKRDPGYSVPRKVHYECTQDKGSVCNICPMRAKDGDAKAEIPSGDPVVLEMMDASKSQVHDIVRSYYGIPKCNRLDITVEQHQSVEILYARPSVDHVRDTDDAGDYKNMKVTSVGRHDTLPNNTVQVVGALHPGPRNQGNEFQAWEVNRMETSLDHFEVNDRTIALMERFQPDRGQTPLQKLGEISRSMADHVTKIYGRPEMHAAIDLVYHSVLGFDLAGAKISKGWLELALVGDTRTGKSEAASKLAQHYAAGEVVSCESATFAGIVGGLQQYGSGKEWAVSWGAIPINDRRLVVLDEVSGLSYEEIARMSSVRSSGTAELTKIQSERTLARTRLIWIGNPRNGRMSDYTYGVQALRPLIGNDEDIARFDFALCVTADEVSAEEINRQHRVGVNPYPSEAAQTLVRWAWSRRPEHIVWMNGAEEAVMDAAKQMGRRYIEDPPLIQAANARVKIARVAVALAARLFSSDADAEYVLVRPEHVVGAVGFLDRVYGMRSFGYAERSMEMIHDRREAEDHRNKMERYLEDNPNLAKFLRTTGQFRRVDLEEVMNVDRIEANSIINVLWEHRMVRKDKGDIKVEPTLHSILREVKA